MNVLAMGRGKWPQIAVHALVVAAVAWGILHTVDQAMEQLSGETVDLKLDPGWLVLSGLLYLLGLLPMAAFWYRSLRALGQQPKIGETLAAYYVGSLGKYVPGKAMVVVMRLGLLRSERVSGPVAAVSIFLETLTMMAVGAFLSILMMVFWLNDHLSGHSYLLPLAVGLLVLSGVPTLPPVVRRLTVLFGVRRADPDIEKRLDGLTAGLMAYGWTTISVGWLLMSLSLWAVLKGMGLEGIEMIAHLPYFIAAVAMAMVAGFLSLMPGGAGVREFIIAVILGRFYFAGLLDVPMPDVKALAAAVILRLVWLAAELIVAAVFYVRGRGQAVRQSDDPLSA